MNKKKILVLAMTLSIIAILAMGATLAYFTDSDNKANTFTVGNVDIEIVEKIHDGKEWKVIENGDFGKLEPGVVTANNKDIFTYNKADDAYIRNYVAIEDIDDGNTDPDFHLEYQKETVEWTNPDEIRYGVEVTKHCDNLTLNGRIFDVYVFDVIGGEVVKAGELNHVLSLTSFNIDESFTNELAKAFGKIEVYTVSEAIQAAGLTHAEAMAELQGEGTLEEHIAELFAGVVAANNI